MFYISQIQFHLITSYHLMLQDLLQHHLQSSIKTCVNILQMLGQGTLIWFQLLFISATKSYHHTVHICMSVICSAGSRACVYNFNLEIHITASQGAGIVLSDPYEWIKPVSLTCWKYFILFLFVMVIKLWVDCVVLIVADCGCRQPGKWEADYSQMIKPVWTVSPWQSYVGVIIYEFEWGSNAGHI